jgi:hypothetical protein
MYNGYLDGPDCYEDIPTWEEINKLRKKLETIEDFFSGVLEEVYGESDIDVEKLENYLDEIAHQVDLSIPASILKVTRRKEV